MEPKQIIVWRHDLKVRNGKLAAQVAHASLKVVLDALDHQSLNLPATDPLMLWINNKFAKIVVRVDSLEELLTVHENAQKAGIRTALIQDDGRTEFHGEPTYTCCAIGPDFPDRIDPITGHLKLM